MEPETKCIKKRILNVVLGPRWLALAVVMAISVYVFEVFRGHSTAEAAVTTAVDGSASDAVRSITVGDESTADELLARKDPIKSLLDIILDEDFDDLEEVAIGRYLRDAREGTAPPIPEDISVEAMRCVRRGKGWLLVEAPFETWDETKEPAIQTGQVQLRLIQCDESWKLEHVTVLKGQRE